MEQQVRIKDQQIRYNVSYRDIKHPRLEFKTGDLLLVLPKNFENHEGLLQKHETWIYKRESLIKTALKESEKKKLKQRTDKEFRDLVHSYIENVEETSNLQINKLFFRRMKSKWGSLSHKKNLTLNTFLKYLPKTLLEYVIYHEMAHSIEKKHNERYWKTVSKTFPDHRRIEKDLLVYWFLVQKQVT